jgi:predicted DCC family thiol-disulfide oxidoreductase YuxK
MTNQQKKYIVLFDGYCNLCSWSVQFIIRNDSKKIFLFDSLQSEKVNKTWPDLTKNGNFQTVILLENGKKFFRSSAALRIARRLKFPVNLLAVFFIVPPFLRDFVYNWIARNRYRWFGKREVCFLPGKEGGSLKTANPG